MSDGIYDLESCLEIECIMEKKIINNLYLLIPVTVTILLTLMVYIVKGVYPFGNSNIGYYDMNQTYIACYGRAYEVLSGKDSIVFDWFEGAGMDMCGTFQGSIISPFSWPFLFIKMDYVLDYMAWSLMLKLLWVSLCISWYIKKIYDLPLGLHVVLSVMYTFSGYTLQFYTNIGWLDTVAILPVLVLFIRSMHHKKHVFPYGALLTFELMTNQYLSFMVLVFILLYSLGLAYTETDINQRRAFIARLGFTTFISLAVSSVMLIPGVLKWTKLSRTSGTDFDIFTVYGFSISEFQHQKLFMLFNTELAVALFGILIISCVLKKRKLSRETIFKLYIFFIMLMPVLNEGTNLLWHMGSYVHFPFRCAFMLTFTGIDLIAYVWNKCSGNPIFQLKAKIKQIVIGVIVAMIAVANIVIGVNLYITFFEYGIIGRTVSYYGLPELLILNVIFYVLLMCFFNKKIRERVFCIVTMIHLTVASVCFIAPVDYSRQDDYSYYVMRDKFIHDSLDIRNNAHLDNDYVSRIKTLYPCLSRNYAMILGIPSITQFMSESVATFFNEVGALGYDNNYTTNLDSGGTYFSDAILNDKKVITYGDVYVPENAYTKYTSVGEYTIYDMNYTLPFGILADEKILDTNSEKLTAAEHQVQVAEAFSDDDTQVFNILDSSDAELISSDKENNKYIFRYDLHATSSSLLYICTRSAYNVSVNDREVTFPYFDETENMRNIRAAKNAFNLIAGFARDEDAKIDITLPSDNIEKLQLVVLDLDAMARLSEKYEKSSVSSYKVDDNRLNMTADVDGNNYLFLPLEYLDGWHAKVNGEKAEIIPVMNGAFMAVKLPDGHCEINMTFMPPTIIKGTFVTLIGLAAAAVLFIMKKRGKDIAEIPWVAKTASVCFNFVAVAALVVMYILPVFI